MESKHNTTNRLASPTDPFAFDPVKIQIRQELEEFLRDLTLEFPFPEIFEILKRHEFRTRYGNVLPLPNGQYSPLVLKEIHHRILEFLQELRHAFGRRYYSFIENCFQSFTETTLE